ncbi:hypothetical protein SUGI_1074920 [Cryptomeria japonica]|uniref:peroxidase 4 n=1 Tax=Cryptomeria japonica TaxID=3369 RepID=UPI0024148F55|nr:peroxidase 4 [Cryptomeria japonica]GLJ50450.1 hypothetical protein SUGI_1074920 [Cryptomeria japonica]
MAKATFARVLLVVALSMSISIWPACSLNLLSLDYYEKSCPMALSIIKSGMEAAVAREVRNAALVLRLHFHDCFVQGCDGSVLLDDTPTFTGEKTASPNINSLRGFEIIDDIKEQLEKVCPGAVSCADILTVAARDAVILNGGPYWHVPLGRKDSRTASLVEANTNIPTPNSTLAVLIRKFLFQGLTPIDLVALSGAHTIGQARCTNFRDRIYGSDAKDTRFSLLKASCPLSGGDNNISPLDFVSPTVVDNAYYKNLVNERGLLISDQELTRFGSVTSALVKHYADDPLAFWNQFSDSMVSMGNIVNPLTFLTGEVRKNCRRVN